MIHLVLDNVVHELGRPVDITEILLHPSKQANDTQGKNKRKEFTTIVDSDQPAHLRSLTWLFNVRSLKICL